MIISRSNKYKNVNLYARQPSYQDAQIEIE